MVGAEEGVEAELLAQPGEVGEVGVRAPCWGSVKMRSRMGGRYRAPRVRRPGSRARPKVNGCCRVETWPELRTPVMVFAFTGWVDAGFAGAGAIAALGEAARVGDAGSVEVD